MKIAYNKHISVMTNNSTDIVNDSLVTDSTTSTFPNKRKADLEIARYFSVVLTVLSMYTFVVLIYHWCKRKKNQERPIATILCLLSGGFSFLLCLNKLAELWVGPVRGVSCETYHIVATTAYGIGLAFVYTALWIRQRKLYSDDLLVHTVSKLSRIVSAVVIVIIYCLLFCVFVSFIAILDFEENIPSCHINWKLSMAFVPLVICLISICFFLQLVLFLLMVNPLRQDRSICGDVLCSRSTTDIHSMLKRLALCACCCIFSTILLSIAILLDAVEIICIYWGNLVALDLLISTLATVCSFADWLDRILPMFSNFATTKNKARKSVVLESISSKHNLHNSYSTSETKSILINDIEHD